MARRALPAKRGARPLRISPDPGPSRPGDPRSTALRNVFIGVMIAIFIALLFFGIDAILETQADDAKLIAELSYTTDEVNMFDSYAAAAYVYAMIPKALREIYVYMSALAFIAIVMWKLRGLPALSLAAFLLVAPLILFLTLFNKETILLAFVFLAYAFIFLFKTNKLRFIAIALIYTAYGIFFRQYFLLIIGMIAYLVLFRGLSPGRRLALVAVTIVGLFAVPNEVFAVLHDTRDVINYPRIGYSDVGYRTVFINPIGEDTPISFVLNYLYALVRLNLPIIFDLGLKEMFLMINALVYFAVVVVGLKFGNERAKFSSLIFLAHLAILTIFEPDLGSYLRHASTALVFLAPALATFDRAVSMRPPAGPSPALRRGGANRRFRPKAAVRYRAPALR